ncbi:MAG: sugar ABC transporter substrate-binding protein [Actinomycetota bacterium]|nr:sugar ABC transporter substrate-binding protein [Actinomycetota bacterium]
MRWTHKAAVAAGCAAMLVTAACSSSSTGTAATSSTSAANAGSAPAGSSSAPAPSAAGSASAPAGSMTAGSAPSASAPAGSAPAASASAGAAPAGAALTKNPATDGKTINVLMVNNPQMIDLQKLTAKNFTAQTGIKVNYTVLPEGDMRKKATLEFTSQAGQYDVATLSNFEIPIYGSSDNNWLTDLTDYSKKDTSFNQSDIFPAFTKSLTVDGKLYGEPFYGESSFLMYRKDVLAAKGVTMPENPTWDQVAAAAAKLDGAQPGMKGICLRGKPGWGDFGAPLTTVINTFGGTWWDKDWNAKVNDPATVAAVKFYTDLVKQHGEVSPDQASFPECLNALQQGKVAMWYDATSAAGSLEASDSPVKGKIGYAQAPVKSTKSSGWLYTWSWAMEKASKNQDAAWQFISWASSSAYENEVGKQLGWAQVPAGKRTSLYNNPQYTAAAGSFAPATLKQLSAADPTNPGVQPRPTVGIQFVDINDFQAFGDDVTGKLAADVLAGGGSVDDWVKYAQSKADAVGSKQK